jgi:hypothetical protein
MSKKIKIIPKNNKGLISFKEIPFFSSKMSNSFMSEDQMIMNLIIFYLLNETLFCESFLEVKDFLLQKFPESYPKVLEEVINHAQKTRH